MHSGGAGKAAEVPWKSDATATKYIQELLANPVQRVTFKRALPEDGRSEMEELHVFKLESTLQNDEQRTSSAEGSKMPALLPAKTEHRNLLLHTDMGDIDYYLQRLEELVNDSQLDMLPTDFQLSFQCELSDTQSSLVTEWLQCIGRIQFLLSSLQDVII
eukprot:g67886.t1